MWNWSKFVSCDDVVFIKSCINDALEWNSMATIKGKNCFEYAIVITIGLYYIHQHFDWDPKTMEQWIT
jgi:hypothetical protein